MFINLNLNQIAHATGKLVIEVPLAERERHPNSDLMPRVVTTDTGKAVAMSFAMPECVLDAKQVHVSVKDRDLVVRVQDTKSSGDASCGLFFYKRVTLPANTDWERLKVTLDGKTRKLAVVAPLREKMASGWEVKEVPVNFDK